ncbi:GNAT family N-acetyltransferase [Massilia sp. PWRC2]|uniref:GNAT family N-acetyltransferase n=1 Tax=Massilia sp. PWRC2 TaxID=2804626 RepID=UPI003CF9384F
MQVAATARLRLRTLTLADAGFYLAVVNTPQFLRWIGDRQIRTEAQAREALAQGPLTMQAMRGFSLYLVERSSDGAAIGMCGLIKRASLADVDLGYAYLPEFAGHGYATEAACAVLEHARARGLPRVVAITTPGNDGSDAVLRRAGMHFECMLQLSAEEAPVQLFAIALAPPQ